MQTYKIGGVYFFILVFSIYFFYVLAKDIVFVSIKCDGDEETVSNISCEIKEDENRKKFLHLSATLLSEQNNIMSNAALLVKRGGLQVTLFNYTEDVCHIMNKHTTTPEGQLAVRIMGNTTNILHQCPYEGFVYITDIYPDKIIIPNLVPSGEYIIQVILLNTGKFLGKVTIVSNYN